MPLRGQTILAVVPARGGSKAIPRKNLCRVGGLSLVARAGQLAASLPWLDARVLSTDDDEIADEGRTHGLDVPFMRPDDLSGDLANSIDMWRHAWLESEKHYGKRFDISVLLEPTSPLRRAEDITGTVELLLSGDYKAAATVSPAPAHFTPHKCLTVTEGMIGFYHDAGAKHSIRQTIPRYYFRNGICYAVRRQTLIEENTILGDNCAANIIDRYIVNIDDPFDLELADFLLQRESHMKDAAKDAAQR
jgi:CMP-N-acetylneuraminic acid synthetase